MIGAFIQLRQLYIVWVMSLVVISIIVSRFLIKENIRRREIFNDADDDVSAARVDNLVNFDTVKYFAGAQHCRATFSHFSTSMALWETSSILPWWV